MSAPRGPSFEDALAAVKKPLKYAARNDFKNVERIRDLEGTLAAAAERAASVAPRAVLAHGLRQLAARLRAPEDDRVARLRATVEALESIERGEVPEPTAPPAKPSTRPTRKGQLGIDAAVQYVRGVGPTLAAHLGSKELRTARDLLMFLPRRYEDRALRSSIRELSPGAGGTAVGEVIAKSQRVIRGRRTLEVVIGDPSGVLRLQWFRVPGASFAERFAKGARLRVSGNVKMFRGQLHMAHPEVAFLDNEAADVAPAPEGVVPIYSEVEGVRPAHLRRVIHAALPAAGQLEDALPADLLRALELPPLAEAVRALHEPPPDADLSALLAMATPWHRRLIYEELLLLQLVVLRRKAAAAAEPGKALALTASLESVAAELFAFALTGAQRRALGDIEADLRLSVPMHRLLQGDVGSGKTAVALAAAAAVARSGHQAAIMAPTELLAEQHARNALKALPKAGVRTALLTGNVSAAERRKLIAGLASGQVQVVVGTHALIQADVRFASLALAVVDEQHRFGVLQRARLLEQGREGLGVTPHVLVMTATPIPRTLALTVYGDLDLSLIDELPPGRTPVQTLLFRERQRDQVYRRVRHAVASGRQAYVVFPLVEDSDKEGMESIRAATTAAEELAAGALAGLRLGVLHGRMDTEAKDRTMRAFAQREIDVLVATTVIEVGIDVPNASVMVIEHAERFGLSQLHQLRGRVGRGTHASECLLLTSGSSSDDAWRRLTTLERTSDGFKIAEVDLDIRGAGDIVGTRQSGLPTLSFANPARDQELLLRARRDAVGILEIDPRLEQPRHAKLAALLASRWERRLELARIG